MGVSLCDLHGPSAFSGRAGFEVDARHISARGVPCWGGSGAGDGGAGAAASREAQCLLCSVALLTLSGAGQLPACWSRNPEGQA